MRCVLMFTCMFNVLYIDANFRCPETWLIERAMHYQETKRFIWNAFTTLYQHVALPCIKTLSRCIKTRNKIHISAQPCNILYLIHCYSKPPIHWTSRYDLLLFDVICQNQATRALKFVYRELHVFYIFFLFSISIWRLALTWCD